MKKIGILFGQEQSFPPAFVDRVNQLAPDGIMAEKALVTEVMQAEDSGYVVLVDRISQDVPFYRSFLKNAAACGTAVINNPFWWSADEKFFNNVLAEKIGVPVPKTVLLPSKEMPEDTDINSFRNLKYPLDWEKVKEYLGGFPMWMKPHSGGGWKSVYKVNNFEELFSAYSETGHLVMMLQENIEFEYYFRCYCVGKKYVHLMPYEPRNPHHLRYLKEAPVYPDDLLDKVKKLVLKINNALGYDFNTVEFAVKDGVPFAIDFCNPAPDAEISSVGEDNFEWVVQHAALAAIEAVEKHDPGKINLSWGTFMQESVK